MHIIDSTHARTYMSVHKYILQQYSMASQGSSDSSFEKASVIRGHHIQIYMDACRWRRTGTTTRGWQRPCSCGNEGQRVIGHVPWSISRVSWFFLIHGGCINRHVTSKRKCGNGLEVPCVYILLFYSKQFRN